MQNVQLLIHGQSVDASNQATFERISPIDGTVATKAAAATLEDVDRAIDSAQQAFKVWSKLSPTERRLRLLKAADLMDQKPSNSFKLECKKQVQLQHGMGLMFTLLPTCYVKQQQ